MKTLTLPLYDHDETLTPVLHDFADKFVATSHPTDSDKIVLTFEKASDANALAKALGDIGDTGEVEAQADSSDAPAVE